MDALRAIAMLLGIVLHAGLSFVEFGWLVKDNQTHFSYSLMVEAIHGFRMPLFFLISGFFTAMLWRKRGLKSLMWHRFKRIFLPLVVGLFTIIPITFAVDHFVKTHRKDRPQADAEMDVWQAIYGGDVEAFLSWAEQPDFDPAEMSPDGNSTMLSSAAFLGHPEIVELLIEHGADVNQRNKDKGTPLHAAAFLGRWKSAKLLIDHGADVSVKNGEGKTASQVTHFDWGTTQFVAGMFDVPIQREQVESGRERVNALIKAADGEAVSVELNQPGESNATSDLINFLVYFPILNHLWFLWFLCMFVVVFVPYCWLVDSTQVEKWLPRILVASPLCILWLIPLTMWPQVFMNPGSFGADTNVGVLPMPQVVAYYAIFFFFGALYWDYGDTKRSLYTGWWLYLLLAMGVVYPAALAVRHGFSTDIPNGHLWFNFLQAVYAWLMILGSMGLFNYFFARESKTMRYISDSSYWLYVAHLPLVVFAQWLVCDWSMPGVLKFALICMATTALLMVSYEYGVRYTPIGTLLNGKRYRNSSNPSQASE